MSLDATLRLLTKASGLTAADLAAAIPRAGVSTVKAWLAGEKMPGSEQLNALARAFGVPAGALLSELASTLDPARTQAVAVVGQQGAGMQVVAFAGERFGQVVAGTVFGQGAAVGNGQHAEVQRDQVVGMAHAAQRNAIVRQRSGRR